MGAKVMNNYYQSSLYRITMNFKPFKISCIKEFKKIKMLMPK